MQTSRITEWVHLCENWCEPDWTHWCDGSPKDLARLVKLMSYSDVTSLSAASGAGRCVTPAEAMTQIALECRGRVRGRVMYIVPYLLPGDDAGVLVTHSAARAAQLFRMAKVGTEALTLLATGREFAAELYLSGTQSDGELSIRCHLSGPAVTETDCRTDSRPRRNLPMQTRPIAAAGKSTCVSCGRLCPNRVRAIAAASSRDA